MPKQIILSQGNGAGNNSNNSSIGTLASLTTTAKSDLVSAINEVNAKPSGVGRSILGIYYAQDYGLHGDGVTDDTALFQAMINDVASKGGGIIWFDAKVYLIAGELQDVWSSGDTGGANAQIQLPNNPLTNPMLIITLKGAVHPIISHFVWNDAPLRHATVFKTTYTNPTNNPLAAVFAGTSFTSSNNLEPNQNHVQLNVIDIICEAPYDPKITFFNLKYHMANRMQNLVIYGGSTSLAASCYQNAPVNSDFYGIKFPTENHTPNNIVENVRVMGYYWGVQTSECMNVNGLRLSGVYKAINAQFGYHISIFRDLHVYWSPYGICADVSRVDNKNRLRILGYGIEHRGTSGGAAWMNNVADVYDPNNYLVGDMVYCCVKGGIGNLPSDFVKVGGANFHCKSIEDVGAGL